MLWIVVLEPFWLNFSCVKHGFVFMHQPAMPARAPGRLDKEVSVLVSDNLAVIAGPLVTKNQRATENGVDKKFGATFWRQAAPVPVREKGVAKESGKKRKSHAAGSAQGKFANITPENLGYLQKNLHGQKASLGKTYKNQTELNG